MSDEMLHGDHEGTEKKNAMQLGLHLASEFISNSPDILYFVNGGWFVCVFTNKTGIRP